MTTAWALLAVAVLLIAGNAVFVAAETALVTVDGSAVERAAATGHRRPGLVVAALRQLSTYLSGAQLGITITSLAIGLVTEPSGARLLHGPIRALGLGDDAADTVAIALALLAATIVQMVFGELVPKNIALARPLETATAVIAFLVGFGRAARPLIRLLNGTANWLLRRVGITPVEELRSARSPDELAFVVRRAGMRGTLDERTATLLERSLTFGRKSALDVMTPRVRMHTVSAGASVSAVIAATRATGHSRFPVIGEGVDDVVGVVHVKQAVAAPLERRDTTAVAEVATPPVTVPTTIGLDPLLEMLQEHGLQMAVVIDEYGGTAGLVTFEDIVEELVGDVVDEHDVPVPGVRHLTDGSWVVSGLLRPDEVRTATGLHVPHGRGDYETIAGLVVTLLHRMPDLGDQVTLPGVTLIVEGIDGHRVDRIRLVPDTEPEQVGRADRARDWGGAER